MSDTATMPRALIVEDEIVIAMDLEAQMRKWVSMFVASHRMRERLCRSRWKIRLTSPSWRQIRDLFATPVIFITAYGDDEGLMDRIRQQVPEAIVLPKPLYGSRLADTIARLEQDKAGAHRRHA